MKKGKGQVFVQDIVIALVIMSMVLIIYFGFYTNQNIGGEASHKDLLSETRAISDYLTTTGYPEDWNFSNVVRIGITDDSNSIDKKKLEMFKNMSRDDYNMARSLLKTRYDYIIFFRDYDENVLNISGEMFIGKAGVNSTNLDQDEKPAHISKVSRFLVLKEGTTNTSARIVEMVIYVWSKEI